MGNPYQGDDEDPFSGVRDEEGNVKRNMSFSSAFREARRRGDKKFTWKGKSYTTELAKPKPAKVDTRAEDEMTDTERRVESAKKASNERASQQGYFGSMKKGGMVKSSASKRADGCATRGKTRGKLV